MKTVSVRTTLDPSRAFEVSPKERDDLEALGILKKDAVEKSTPPTDKKEAAK